MQYEQCGVVSQIFIRHASISFISPLHSPHLFLFFIFPLSPSVPLEWVRPRVEGVEDDEEEYTPLPG